MMASESYSGVVFYDGECPLCNAAVRFLLRYDRHRYFRFCPLGSARADRMLAGHFFSEVRPDSLIVLAEGQVSVYSEAVLVILRHMPRIWKPLLVLGLIPRGWRDRVYRYIAARRRSFSAKPPHCALPPAHLRYLFLY